MNALSYVKKQGVEILSVFDELALLRIAVFKEYPYLYEGTVAYEQEYLQPYVQAKHALLFAAYSGHRMVGATTCIPLADETAAIRQPFLEAGYSQEAIFYFGESIVLPEYRGQGLGHRFFDEREAHARSFGRYHKTAFFSVERPDDHPLKPVHYRSNADFWTKRGYVKYPKIQATLEWPDLGETASTPKQLVCWMRDV